MHYANLTPGRGFSLASSLLYYSQRLVTAPRLRAMVVRGIAAGIRARLRQPSKVAPKPAELASLQRDGYLSLGQLLTPAQCAAVRDYLADKSLISHDAKQQVFALAKVPHDTGLAEYQLQDLINSPHLLALANSPRLLDLATDYIGCRPTISAMSLRWSFPTTAPVNTLQAFHRDADDWRYLKVLVYLTDVGEFEGPHVFVKGTHVAGASVKLCRYSDASVREAYPPAAITTVLGLSGSGFVVDTAGIHKGMAPSARPRLLLQIQYSLLPAYFYVYEPVRYLGALALDPYVNRLIVAC